MSSSTSTPVHESDVEKEMKKRCASLDEDNSGFLTISQLQSVMQQMGEDVGVADVEEMVDEAGCKHGQDRVDYQKFITAFHAAIDEDEAVDL
jgi:Ca2+-binding EF-hand superfamily protein